MRRILCLFLPIGKITVSPGMQIVRRPFDDLSVFRAAAAFETIAKWDAKRPEVPETAKKGGRAKKRG